MKSRLTGLAVVILLLMGMTSPLMGTVMTLEGEGENSTYGVEGKQIPGQGNETFAVVVDAPSKKEGNVHDEITYDFEITNHGMDTDSYSWSANSGHDWLISADEGSTRELATNETEIVSLTVRIPGDADPYTADRLVLNATSQTDLSVSDEGVTYTYTDAVHSSEIVPETSELQRSPGSEFFLTYSLTNTGNVIDDFTLSSYIDNPYWETSVEEKTGPLEPNETIEIDVHVSIPEVNMEYKLEEKDIYYEASKSVVLRAEAENGVINSTDPIPTVTVGPYYSATLQPIEPYKFIDYSQTTTDVAFDLKVKNLCNIRGDEDSKEDINVTSDDKNFESAVDLDEALEAQRWTISVSAPNITLIGGETDVVRARVTAPREPINGTFSAVFAAEPTPHENIGGPVHTGSGEAKVIVNQTGDVNVSASQEMVEGKPLEHVALNFTVENIGNGIDNYGLYSSTENNWETEIVNFNRTITNLQPGEEVDVRVRVKIPDKKRVGFEEEVELTATSLFEKTENDNTVSDSARAVIRVQKGYSVILKPDMNETMTYPEETVSYQINVTNAGNTEDRVMLSLDHEDTTLWGAELEDRSLTIERWNTTTTELHVTPSSDALHGEPFNVTVIGTSVGNSSKSDNSTAITQVFQVPDVSVGINETSLSMEPGETLDLDLLIKNEGNALDTFDISGGVNKTDWEVEIEEDTIELESAETGSINISVTAPEIPADNSRQNLKDLGILGGDFVELNMTATSQSNSSISDTLRKKIVVEDVSRRGLKSFERKDVLPGDSVTHRIRVENLGNSDDMVSLYVGEDETDPYADHADLDERNVELGVGASKDINLTVEVPLGLQPYWHQEIDLSVGDENFSTSTETETRVVMLDCEDPSRQIKVGKNAEYDFDVVNVPLEREITDEDLSVGDPLPDTMELEGAFKGLTEEGWNVTFSKERTEFQGAYEEESFSVVLDAPRVETERVQRYDVTASSTQRDMNETVTTETQMSWFDLRPTRISIEKGPDGREMTIIFEIKRSGRGDISTIPFDLLVDGDKINQEEIRLVESRSESETEDVFRYRTVYELESWSWGETVREYDVTVRVDPDDEIYMINAQGNAEENNVRSEESTVSKYEGVPYWIPILILIASLIAFIGCRSALERYNGLSVGLGISLGGIFGSLIVLPWSSFISNVQTVEYITLALIAGGMILFGILLITLRFKLKNMLSSLIHHIIKKNGWEKHVDEDISDEKEGSPYMYYIALSLTGLFSFLTFLLVTSSDLIFLGEYSSIFTSGFMSHHVPAPIPNLIFLFVYLAIGMAVGFTAGRHHKTLWKRIVKDEKKIEKLQDKARHVVEGGERRVSRSK
ncbi:MAG: hypothetical protein KGY76_08505 [Candidatus Thermoplasmatota archaeon]|nr:hypothetical protein [Candidatus Thermoplasmatota archaeon]